MTEPSPSTITDTPPSNDSSAGHGSSSTTLTTRVEIALRDSAYVRHFWGIPRTSPFCVLLVTGQSSAEQGAFSTTVATKIHGYGSGRIVIIESFLEDIYAEYCKHHALGHVALFASRMESEATFRDAHTTALSLFEAEKRRKDVDYFTKTTFSRIQNNYSHMELNRKLVIIKDWRHPDELFFFWYKMDPMHVWTTFITCPLHFRGLRMPEHIKFHEPTLRDYFGEYPSHMANAMSDCSRIQYDSRNSDKRLSEPHPATECFYDELASDITFDFMNLFGKYCRFVSDY